MIKKIKEAVIIKSKWHVFRSAHRHRSQNQISNGTEMISPKPISNRNNHPELPKVMKIPMETKASKKAFAKAMGYKKQGTEKKTAKADNKKGKKTVRSRQMIDTEQKTALRIKERKGGPA
ncbi:MAG: hypothetical protein IJA75_00210 [Oscillospiraceae bacterium]|nr:hypothetical protein [Oscillospiraceae bacterium]